VLWFGAKLVLAGALSAGGLVVFILYLGKMYKPMQEISKMTDTYSKAAVGYERIQEILQTHVDVKDARRARRAPRLKGNIEFKDVSFSYDHETPVLKNVSLQIKAGQVSALVGPTGAGKSSIIGLIPRFYDPTSGVITVDGIDVKTLQQKSLRNQMSFVLQETVLFHAPVWQNIAYGKPNCTRGEIIKAAELANAMEFIEKLPNGLDTILGERGMTLSGGQRQRIAIARAVIRNTPILILDEPTNHLDIESVEALEDALAEYEGTILLVSHDRAMLEALTSRVWILHERHVTDFPGSFTEWEEQSREREHAAAVTAAERESLRRVKEHKTTKRRETQGAENRTAIREMRQRVEESEKEVAALEKKVVELTALLEDPELYTTREGTDKSLSAGKQLDEARRKLDIAIEKWTKVTEQAEQLSAT